MEKAANSAQTIRFGVFEVDPHSGELRKAGRKVLVQDLPVRLLLVLLKRPGEVVTREELREALWPADTYVDFDRSLHTAVAKLRKALGDSAESPRFLETVPRRGCRFLADVETVAGGPTLAETIAEPPHPPGGRWWFPAARPAFGQTPATWARHPRRWAAVLGLAAAIAGGVARFQFARKGPHEPVVLLKTVPLNAPPGIQGMPAFSPDATRVAFCWRGEGQVGMHLFVKLVGPGNPLQLTSGSHWDTNPAWSPDGSVIAFLRSLPGGRAAVTLVPALGGPERKVTEIFWTGSELFPPYVAWSPDGHQLVLADAAAPGGPTSLFLFRIQDGSRRSLTTPPADSIGDSSPAFSPDGRFLAFVRSPSYTVGDIYLLPFSEDLDPAGKPIRLTFDNRMCYGLAWAPDSRDLVFSSNRAGSHRLWRIPRSGSRQPQLVASVGDDTRTPAVSRAGPGGSARLVYRRTRLDRDIWRVSVAGDGHGDPSPSRLIASVRDDLSGRYSPDGKRIAFTSDRSGSYEIWICERDGANPVQLTSFGGAAIDGPQWSPDGARVTFHSRPEGRAEIYVIEAAEGGPPRRLTHGPGDNVCPSFSHDGRWIYFGSSRTGRHEIWKMPAEGGTPAQVTQTGGITAIESPDGKVLYYSKSRGQTSLWSTPVGGGPETRIAESLYYLNFAVDAKGVYFLVRGDELSIQFLSHRGGSARSIATIKTGLKTAIFTLNISADAKWILYSQDNEYASELMLVENFK